MTQFFDKKITDIDKELLINSAKALLALDASNSLVPHGIGGLAKSIIQSFIDLHEKQAVNFDIDKEREAFEVAKRHNFYAGDSGWSEFDVWLARAKQDSDEAFAICCDASTSSNLCGCGASSGYELDIDTAKLKWNERSNLPPANAYESVDIIELKRRVHSAIEHATDYETEISENAKQAHARVDLAFSLLANPSPICWKPLSDAQWMNIVNHDHAYENFDKDDAALKISGDFVEGDLDKYAQMIVKQLNTKG